MTLWTGPLLPLAALIWPLLLAALTALPGLRAHGVRFLPLAPLPALWLAIMGSSEVTTAPDLLLGVVLGLDGAARIFLAMTALLWCIAGLAAQPMAGKPNSATFAGFWSLTLTGNLGVFLALDVVTFYVAFAVVSLASWFLIVHDRSSKAQHAGRVYIVIALAGEVALLVGLIIGADAAGSMAIAEVRDVLGTPELVLLVIGFGIKAGLVPLHVWLPLAHPAAPVPASAVLSGAIVKAGLFGMILFVPEGVLGPTLVNLGLVGAFGAALWGLTQSNPKAVLAYSTISQMGLMITLVGAGGAARAAVPYFAVHHGFAKGALFLLVGVMLVAGRRWQKRICLAVAVVVAASVAGLPLTGGALAKAVVKEGLSEAAATALSLSSVTTSLILVWFLVRLWHLDCSGDRVRWTLRLFVPIMAGVLAFALPWFLWPDWSGKEADYLFSPATVRDGIWPIAIALPVALALVRWPLTSRPPGDILVVLERLRSRPIRMPAPLTSWTPGDGLLRAFLRVTIRIEDTLLQWRVSGVLTLLLVLLILVLLR